MPGYPCGREVPGDKHGFMPNFPPNVNKKNAVKNENVDNKPAVYISSCSGTYTRAV